MTTLRTLEHLLQQDLRDKTVLLRADLNVPMFQGRVADTTRIDRVVPTIKALLKVHAKVVVISHFGRPKGEFNRELSLAPITDTLGDFLGGVEVMFAVDCVGTSAREAVSRLNAGDVLLLENLRFHQGETANDPEFIKELATLGDYFVNDAFSCSHRAHASIVGLSEALPSVAGLLLQSEIDHLESALENPEKPVVAMVGGSKISTKIDLLKHLVTKVDYLMVGGGMANTFLYAQGYAVGTSLCEKDRKDTALEIMKNAEGTGCKVLLPEDVIVAESLEQSPPCRVVAIDEVPDDQMMLDIGPDTVSYWSDILRQCKTLVWNGPLGAFEYSPFDVGSISIAREVSSLTQHDKLKSIAGGGDVLACLTKAGLRGTLTYISTAGGAFLEWLEGKELPGIKVLVDENSDRKQSGTGKRGVA